MPPEVAIPRPTPAELEQVEPEVDGGLGPALFEQLPAPDHSDPGEVIRGIHQRELRVQHADAGHGRSGFPPPRSAPQAIQDFLPAGVTYDPGSAQPTSADTVDAVVAPAQALAQAR